MAAKLVDLAEMTTNTVGTGSLNLTGAVSPFLTYEQAGGASGDSNISYAIYDPNGPGCEMGLGTYTNVAGVLTLTRDSVRRSSGTANTGKISVSGSAMVLMTPASEDILTKPASNVANSLLVNGASASAFAFWSDVWSVDPTSKALFGNFNTASPVAGGLTAIDLQIVGADSTNPRLVLDAANGNWVFNFRRANNTYGSPSAVANGNNCGGFNWFGHNGSAYVTGSKAAINATANEDWTTIANGLALRFNTTAQGSTTVVTRLFVGQTSGGLATADSSGTIVTGGDKGPGTFNASGLYLLGVSLAGNLPATATNDSATAGNVGEYVKASLDTAHTVSLVSNAAKTVMSISLTAGDWDVEGSVGFSVGSGATLTQALASISQTADTAGNGSDTGPVSAISGISVIVTNPMNLSVPRCRVSITSTTTIYLIGSAQFSGGTTGAYGFISARRVR